MIEFLVGFPDERTINCGMADKVPNPYARRVDGVDECARCGEAMWHAAHCRHAQESWRMWCQVTNGNAPREKCECGTCRVVRRERTETPTNVWLWVGEREQAVRAAEARTQPVAIYRNEVRARHMEAVETATSGPYSGQPLSTEFCVTRHDWQERTPRRQSGRRTFRRQWAAQSEVRRIMRAS